MSWRLARSLTQLQAELDKRSPGRTKPDWTIGDPAHAGRSSDHNPNPAGVVCAIDVRSADVARAVWEHLLARRDPRVKYMIFQRRIVSSTVSPWQVRSYSGSNPHQDHIHISVGRGPDGRSTGNYDDASLWGLASAGSSSPSPKEVFLMALSDAQQEELFTMVRHLHLGRPHKTYGSHYMRDHVIPEIVRRGNPPTIVRLDDEPEWWLYDGFFRKHVLHQEEADLLVFLGHASPLNDDGQAHRLAGKQAQAVRSAEIIREETPGRIDVDLDPEAIAAAVVDALPPELAQQVVAEIGVKLGEADGS